MSAMKKNFVLNENPHFDGAEDMYLIMDKDIEVEKVKRPFDLSSKTKYLRAFVQADTIQIGGDEIITAISAYIPDHDHNAITAYIQPMQHQESQFRFV